MQQFIPRQRSQAWKAQEPQIQNQRSLERKLAGSLHLAHSFGTAHRGEHGAFALQGKDAGVCCCMHQPQNNYASCKSERPGTEVQILAAFGGRCRGTSRLLIKLRLLSQFLNASTYVEGCTFGNFAVLTLLYLLRKLYKGYEIYKKLWTARLCRTLYFATDCHLISNPVCWPLTDLTCNCSVESAQMIGRSVLRCLSWSIDCQSIETIQFIFGTWCRHLCSCRLTGLWRMSWTWAGMSSCRRSCPILKLL